MKKFVHLSLVVFFIALQMTCNLKTSTAQNQTGVKKQLVPGEQAPPANPGQKNFGGMRPPVGSPGQPRSQATASGTKNTNGFSG